MLSKGIDGEIAISVMRKLKHDNFVAQAFAESASGQEWMAVAKLLNLNC